MPGPDGHGLEELKGSPEHRWPNRLLMTQCRVSVCQEARRPHLVSVEEKSRFCPMKVSAQTTLCRSQMGSVWLILVQAGTF